MLKNSTYDEEQAARKIQQLRMKIKHKNYFSLSGNWQPPAAITVFYYYSYSFSER
jgi:hypothetical protein